jgi:dihydropyrimidine dehydrogenase (NAD+) subunit PreA
MFKPARRRTWQSEGKHQCGGVHSNRRGAECNDPRLGLVNEAECVGCNLCALVCPVEDCITSHALAIAL